MNAANRLADYRTTPVKMPSVASPLLECLGHRLLHQALQQVRHLLSSLTNHCVGCLRQGRCQGFLQTCFQQQLDARLQFGYYLGRYLGRY